MNRPRRSATEKMLLLRVGLLFLSAHVLTHGREIARTRSRMTSLARALRARTDNTERLAWAVDAVNRHLPGRHSCLVNALACEAVAMNSGIDVEFKIGAAHKEGRMHFHAWVEHNGSTLTGAHDGEFAPLH